MLINHNKNMLCLDEFDILELRENADECDYLFLFRLKLKQRYAQNAGAAMLSITVDILNLSGIST